MSEKTLLASVVLFRELYDSDKDIYDVIAEFTKAAIFFSGKWTITATEASQLLTSEFGLSIPEAVVSTTLKQRLSRKDGVLVPEKGQYTVVKEKLDAAHRLSDELAELRKKQDALLDQLSAHVEGIRGALTDDEKSSLTHAFCQYLFEENKSAPFFDEISTFIINNQNRPGFTGQLNAVREGFVLYDGVRHTPDLNQIPSWRESLIVYLDTEHLFNAAGLNGELYKQLFMDFVSLANDARANSKKVITLKYFIETADEIDRFFHVAERIVDGKASLDPSKQAMVSIVDGCRYKSDVVSKKTKFFEGLKTLGVSVDTTSITDIEYRFNLVGATFLAKIKGEIEERERGFSEEKCVSTLQMLSKINAFRGSRNQGPFESVRHILVSGSFISHFLSFHSDIWGGNGDVPLATDIEYITNRIWFKLHKGLAKKSTHPLSLNILAKAQVVLSSQLNRSVSAKYQEIKKDFDAGKITKENAQHLINELRSKVILPEVIDENSVEEVLNFIDHDGYQHHLRERDFLKQQAEEGKKAVAELEGIKAARERTRFKRIEFLSISIQSVLLMAFVYSYASAVRLGLETIMEFRTEQDTPLSLFGLFMACIPPIIPFFKVRYIAQLLEKSHVCTISWLNDKFPAQAKT